MGEKAWVCSVYSEFVTYRVLLGQLIYTWKSYFCYEPTKSIPGADTGTASNSGCGCATCKSRLSSRRRNFSVESETQKWGNVHAKLRWGFSWSVTTWPVRKIWTMQQVLCKGDSTPFTDNSLFLLSHFPIQKCTVTGVLKAWEPLQSSRGYGEHQQLEIIIFLSFEIDKTY